MWIPLEANLGLGSLWICYKIPLEGASSLFQPLEGIEHQALLEKSFFMLQGVHGWVSFVFNYVSAVVGMWYHIRNPIVVSEHTCVKIDFLLTVLKFLYPGYL